jgi:chaperonin GroES
MRPCTRASFEYTVTTVRPLHDRIIVQRLEERTPQQGAIMIPDSAREKAQRGKVLAAGLGLTRKNGQRIPLVLRAGDIVLFGKFSGQEIRLDGVEYLVMKESDVLAVQQRSF